MNNFKELEDRTTEFAKSVIRICKCLPFNKINARIIDQVVRSAGSIGANYREANEGLSKKDCLYRMRIARKEAKESEHWLELMIVSNPELTDRIQASLTEARELRCILSSIIITLTKKERELNL